MDELATTAASLSRVIGHFIRGRTRQKKAIVGRSGDTVGGSDDVSNMTV